MNDSTLNYKTNFYTPTIQYRQDLEDICWKFKATNIRKRDNYKCRMCGKKTTLLDVHHIRYIEGRKPWEYDDTDLVSLCRDCHNKIHEEIKKNKLREGNYFYHIDLNGVGIVHSKSESGIWFRACWTEIDRKIDGHGRLYVEDNAHYSQIRPATQAEINHFWDELVKYYSEEQILRYFGDYAKSADYLSDTLVYRIVKQRFDVCISNFKTKRDILEKKYGSELLVSTDSFAILCAFGYAPTSIDPHLAGPQFCVIPRSEIFKDFGEYAPPGLCKCVYVKYEDFRFEAFRGATKEDWNAYNYYTSHTIMPGLDLDNYNIDDYFGYDDIYEELYWKHIRPFSYWDFYSES